MSDQPSAARFASGPSQRGGLSREQGDHSFDYQPGYGVTAHVRDEVVRVGNARLVPEVDTATAEGNSSSAVHVAIGDRYAGSILVADIVRDSARRCVADLRGLGLHLVMITGDTAETGRSVADQVGISEVHAELLPADKVDRIDALRAAGRRLALAAVGILGPVLAAIVHVGSESAFILNSARLIPGRRSTRGTRDAPTPTASHPPASPAEPGTSHTAQ